MEGAQVLKTDLGFSLGIASYWLYDLGQISHDSSFYFSQSTLTEDPRMSLHVCYPLCT